MKLIPLSKGKFAKVDDEDYDELNKYKWHYCSGYARRGIKGKEWRKKIPMQNCIIHVEAGLEIDHINGDRSDNQKNNLRVCTHAENQKNKLPNKNVNFGIKGVTKQDGKWYSRIRVGERILYLGNFNEIKDAARAYDDAARKYYGEFARLNFQD